ncbi:hypothetical protein ACFV4P_34390 [Kitasatospora sp. NPDC059795]|uniref:hypothetical protein n=1 Tax=Kitasatospora sp. NPDC059795 TaxID=3346949 RepID=UPI0036581CCB
MTHHPSTGQHRDATWYIARYAPGLSTTTILIAARVWSEQGARHSVGDAVLMGSLALGAAAAGTVSAQNVNGHDLLTTSCYAAAGAAAVCGVAAYSDGLALPVLLWLLATCAVYALAARYWREDRRTATAHAHDVEVRTLERTADLRIAAIESNARVEVAREATAYASSLAEAIWHRQRLTAGTADVPGLDTDALFAAGLPELPAVAEARTLLRDLDTKTR